MRKEIKPN